MKARLLLLAIPLFFPFFARAEKARPRFCLERLLHIAEAGSRETMLIRHFFHNDERAIFISRTDIRYFKKKGTAWELAWGRDLPEGLPTFLNENKVAVYMPSAQRSLAIERAKPYQWLDAGIVAVDEAKGTVALTFQGPENNVLTEVLSLDSGKTLKTIPFATGGHPVLIKVSPDRRRLAVTTQAGHLELWNLASGTLERRLEIEEKRGIPLSIDFFDDGRQLLFATSPHYVLREERNGGFFGVLDLQTLSGPLRYYSHPDTEMVSSRTTTAVISPTAPTQRRTEVKTGVPWMHWVEMFKREGKWYAGFSYFEDGGGGPPQFRRQWILDLDSSPENPAWKGWHYRFIRAVSDDNSKWLTYEMGPADQAFTNDDYRLRTVDPATGKVLAYFPALPNSLAFCPEALSNDGRVAVLRIGGDLDTLGQFWIFVLNPQTNEFEWKGALDRLHDWPEIAQYQSEYLRSHSGGQLRLLTFSEDQTRLVATAEGGERLTRSIPLSSIVERGVSFKLDSAKVRVILTDTGASATIERINRLLDAVPGVAERHLPEPYVLQIDFKEIALDRLVETLEAIQSDSGVRFLR